MSIKTKQVAGVTTLVVLMVALLAAYHLMTMARLSLEETQDRGELITRALFQSATKVVPDPGVDLYSALRADAGVRSILESGLGYGPNIYYVAIVDRNGIAVAHSTPANEGQLLPEQEELTSVINGGSLAQL